MLRWLLLVLLLGIWDARAQSVPVSRPYFMPDTVRAYKLARAHRTALLAQLEGAALPGNADYRNHYRRISTEAATDIYNTIRYSALLDTVLDAAVQRIFSRIQQGNPTLRDVELVLVRNPEPNAYAVGRTVVLNVGLLPTLENESQLAYVLCHELAHVQSRHLQTTLHERLSTLHSRDMRRQVRHIVQAEYNINSRMKELVMGLSLSSSYHQRRHERQADSLGYELLRRTSYAAPQAYRTLQLLDVADAPASETNPELARYFGCGGLAGRFATAPAPAKSIFTVAGPEKTPLQTTDTLKSHPDCAKRMAYLHGLAGGQIAEGPQPVAPAFARLRDLSRLEVLQSWFDTECYDHALYEALRLLPQQPAADSYARAIVQLSLYQLRQRLTEHRFTEVVSNSSSPQPAAFSQYLRTLHELRATDYADLSACFAQLPTSPAPVAASDSDEYALAARYAAAALAPDPAPAATLRRQYLADYPRGRLRELLFAESQIKRKSN
ncbi:M48 family metalloprotease [Hymenobacter lapidiphilus]|uniref:M48 family metalloprotease n=1 Tax=Hymenobacter lapidiphilus TaxID=2608003 RepID=A0A7Y7PRU3_9BACT|nr:M48 family metalloprotease [Hymenobacter lapidiphilus]NVO32890.1 M48 family metalloprotease [Hymenobacter lapidiphilus]